MSQLNLHVKPDFERDLQRFMAVRGIATKSEAIRTAVRESLERALHGRKARRDFTPWLGAALRAPLNRRPRFRGEDDLWLPGDGR